MAMLAPVQQTSGLNYTISGAGRSYAGNVKTSEKPNRGLFTPMPLDTFLGKWVI